MLERQYDKACIDSYSVSYHHTLRCASSNTYTDVYLQRVTHETSEVRNINE